MWSGATPASVTDGTAATCTTFNALKAVSFTSMYGHRVTYMPMCCNSVVLTGDAECKESLYSLHVDS